MISVAPIWEKIRKPFISVLLAYISFGFVMMAWPTNPFFDPKPFLLRPIGFPFHYFWLYNEFRLYAPDPPRHDGSIYYVIHFDDGTVSNWFYPRSKMTPWDSEHSFDRYMCQYFWWNENAMTRRARPGLARYVARQNNSPTRHPVSVDFISRIHVVPDISVGVGNIYPQPFQDVQFYSYSLQPRDLP